MAAQHEEGCCEKNVLTRFLVCKGLSNDDVGAARGTVYQILLGAGFETDSFVKEKSGGATLERLMSRACISQPSDACRGTGAPNFSSASDLNTSMPHPKHT